ncbi:MAG: NAD(P)H-binding protein [Leptospira sp.]|nr:NAD(P)H-binding protein [Leptospira sp.]NCS93700.1 NAD(P)H-binding protein [Leptospira sp.]
MTQKYKNKWLLYGATGYTGKLIARLAKEREESPVLAGRNPTKLKLLSQELNLEWIAFDLSSINEVAKHLENFDTVLHCAGPFAVTVEIMAQACLKSKTNYLDITGEIPVFEYLHKLESQAKDVGIFFLPGVGFDVVPTDCAAAMAKSEMPDATELDLLFVGFGGVSAGTAKSVIAQAPNGSLIRKDGILTKVPQFSISKEFFIEGKFQKLYALPWGDVYTSYISTKIPNIKVFTKFSESVVSIGKFTQPTSFLLKNKTFLKMAQALIGFLIKGPDEKMREKGRTIVQAIVRNSKDEKLTVQIDTLEGYRFTSESALLAIQKISYKSIGSGFFTPSLAFGKDFVLEIPGTKRSNSK